MPTFEWKTKLPASGDQQLGVASASHHVGIPPPAKNEAMKNQII